MSDIQHKPPHRAMESSTGFDFDAVCRNLDGEEPEDAIVKTATTLHKVLEWIKKDAHSNTPILRLNAFLWCVHPGIFGFSSPDDMARLLKVSRRAFDKTTESCREQFKLRPA